MAGEQRVTVRLGLSLPTGDAGDAWIRPEVTLTDIDPAGDVAAQIEVGLTAAAAAFVEIDGRLADTIGGLVEAVRLSRPAEVQRLDVVQRQLAALTGEFNTLVERLNARATAEDLAAAVASGETG